MVFMDGSGSGDRLGVQMYKFCRLVKDGPG